MFCPNCGKEVENGTPKCPNCGWDLPQEGFGNNAPTGIGADPVPTANVEGSAEGVITKENFRSLPTYKGNLKKMVVSSGIGMACALLALLGAILVKFVDTKSSIAIGVVLLMIGLLGGLVCIFAIALPLNKKTFPQVYGVKMKGIEYLVPIFIALGLSALVVALGLLGFTLIIS